MSDDMFSRTDGRTRYKYMLLSFYQGEMFEKLNHYGELGWNVSAVNRYIDSMGSVKFDVTFQLPYWLDQPEQENDE